MAKKGKLSKPAMPEPGERPVRLRRYQYLFLVVCEDENTEPAYFGAFARQIPPETLYLKAVGTGRDAQGVVERALKERNALAQMVRREVDVTWAVFDVDDANVDVGKNRRFQEALKLGKSNNIRLAYSNEVFELWLLLHLTTISGGRALSRKEVYQLLEERIRRHPGFVNFVYTHGDSAVLEVIHKIGNQKKALERAETLVHFHKNKEILDANPSTTVHLLVSDLLGWIRYFSYKP